MSEEDQHPHTPERGKMRQADSGAASSVLARHACTARCLPLLPAHEGRGPHAGTVCLSFAARCPRRTRPQQPPLPALSASPLQSAARTPTAPPRHLPSCVRLPHAPPTAQLRPTPSRPTNRPAASDLPPARVPQVFLISAMFGLGGAVLSLLLLPDTTGLNLEEYDRMQRCLLEGRWDSYHGEAINPKHLSLFERFVLRWDRNYSPEKDRAELRNEVNSFMQHATDLKHPSVDGIHQYMRNPLVAEALPEEFMRISDVAEQAAASGIFPRGGSSMVRRSMPSADKLGRV
eukprot:363904-Chlamydomonas_euryale.AAC.8